MGINGLLKNLESIKESKHISDYKGKRIAIDGYCWLHKSIFSIKNEILDNPNSDKYLHYLIKRLDLLLRFQIVPVFIFDGDKLPAKKNTEAEREKKRSDTRKLGKDYLKGGNLEMAKSKFIESYDVNPRMAYNFIKVLKSKKIEYIVAPYEADAQLAYLEKTNYVDIVMTEDSDLLAYGCKTVLFKFENEGHLDEFNLNKLPECKNYNFKNFTQDSFLIFCILCGCDYFKLERCGVKKAYQIANENRDYKEIISYLKVQNLNITEKVEKDFERAFLTFKFQVVFCPIEKRYRYFNDIENSRYDAIHQNTDLSFLGKILDEDTARKIAYGIIDPITLEKFEESNSSVVKKIFGVGEKPAKSMNNLLEKNNNQSNNNNNIQNYFKKKTNSDISIEISKDSQTHYMENELVYDNNHFQKISNHLDKNYKEIDNSSISNNFSSNLNREEKDIIYENDQEKYFNQFKNNENLDENFLKVQKGFIQKNSQSVNKIEMFTKSLANSEYNQNHKNKLIKMNKNLSKNVSQNVHCSVKDTNNNSQKSFSFLKSESFENHKNTDQVNNDKILSENFNNKNVNLKSIKDNTSLDYFSGKNSFDNNIIDINAYKLLKEDLDIIKNNNYSYSFLSSETINENQTNKKIIEYNTSNINESMKQYFFNNDELEQPKFNKIDVIQKKKNELVVNPLFDDSNENKNLILNNNNSLMDNFTININSSNEKMRINQNINQIFNLNKNQDYYINLNHQFDKKKDYSNLSNENLINNYYYDENASDNIDFRNKQNPLKSNLDFGIKRKTLEFLNKKEDKMKTNINNQNQQDSRNTNLQYLKNETDNLIKEKSNFINPFINRNNTSKEFEDTYQLKNQNLILHTNNNPSLYSRKDENLYNISEYINKINSNSTVNYNSRLENLSSATNNSKIQNNGSLSNLSFNPEINKNNFSNSLASKMSTATFKVLENFDEYLNQYEDINKIEKIKSNAQNKYFKDCPLNTNFSKDSINQNSTNYYNENFDNYQNSNNIEKINLERINSKNISVLNEERKKELILLNNSDSKNPISMQANFFNLEQKDIIDLTHESSDIQIKFTNDNLEEILFSCGDEQIQKELLLSRKKKQKYGGFI